MDYRADIQGLRALAVILVVVYHSGATWLSGGYVGVDVFFVISGYVITSILVKELAASGRGQVRIGLARFYTRRIRRLLPAAYTVVITTLTVGWFVYSPIELERIATSATAAVLYFSNIRFSLARTNYLGESSDQDPFLHTWSLAVEEQFYLIWPVLVYGAFRFLPTKNRSRWLLLTMGMISALSLIASDYLTTYNRPWGFFSPWTRAWEFALGAASFVLSRELQTVKSRHGSLLGWIGLAGIIATALLFDSHTRFPGLIALVPVLGTGALLVAPSICSSQSVLSKFFELPPLQWLGDWSYSLYLWHWPVFIFANQLLGILNSVQTGIMLLTSVFLSWLTFAFVEDPIRRGRRVNFTTRQWIAIGAVAPMVMGLYTFAVRQVSSNALDSPSQRAFAAARDDRPEIYNHKCTLGFQETHQPECLFGDSSGSRTVVLFGDSHAAHWFPALDNLGKLNGWKVYAWTKAACPSFDILQYQGNIEREYLECAQWRRMAIERLFALKPDLVVLGNSKSYLFETGRSNVSREVWQAGIRSTLSRMNEKRIPIVVLGDTPWPGFDLPRCLSRSAWLNRDPLADCRFTDKYTETIEQLEQAEIQVFTNATHISTADIVCPTNPCSGIQNGIVAYYDHSHLAASYSRSLADSLGSRLRQAHPNLF